MPRCFPDSSNKVTVVAMVCVAAWSSTGISVDQADRPRLPASISDTEVVLIATTNHGQSIGLRIQRA